MAQRRDRSVNAKLTEAAKAQDATITGDWTLSGTTELTGGTTLDATVTLRSGSNTLAFTGTGSLADITATGFTRLDFEGLTVIDIQGSDLRIRNASEGSDYGTFSHDGTDFNLDFTNTSLFHLTGPSTGYLFDNGTYLSFRPDGTAAQNPSLTYTAPDHAISLASTTNGDSLAFTLYNQDGTSNPRAAFFMDDTLGQYGLAQTWSSGAQLDFIIASAGTAEFVGDWGSDLAYFRNGNELRVYDSGNNDSLSFKHDGNYGIISLANHPTAHGIRCNPRSSGSDSGWCSIYASAASEGTTSFSVPAGGGFYFIVASNTTIAQANDMMQGIWQNTTVNDLIFERTAGVHSLGTGTNPDVSGDCNVWFTDSGTTMNIKNRRGSFRIYNIFILGGRI